MLLMIFTLLIISLSRAGELEELIKHALEDSPILKTYKHMKRSSEYREVYSKSLPNPSISVGFNNIPINRPYPSKYEPMSSFSIGISQMYILPVKGRENLLLQGWRVRFSNFRRSWREESL